MAFPFDGSCPLGGGYILDEFTAVQSWWNYNDASHAKLRSGLLVPFDAGADQFGQALLTDSPDTPGVDEGVVVEATFVCKFDNAYNLNGGLQLKSAGLFVSLGRKISGGGFYLMVGTNYGVADIYQSSALTDGTYKISLHFSGAASNNFSVYLDDVLKFTGTHSVNLGTGIQVRVSEYAVGGGASYYWCESFKAVGAGISAAACPAPPIPSICAAGLTFFQDLTRWIELELGWTSSQRLGSNEVMASGSDYRYNTDIASPSLDLGSITRTLGGVPSVMQATIGWNVAYTGAGYSTTSLTDFFTVRDTAGGLARYCVKMVTTGFPTVTTTVYLKVVDYGNNQEYSYTLATYVDSVFPILHAGSGTLKVKQIAGLNVEVYWDGVLKFTSTAGHHALTVDAKIEVGQYVAMDTSLYATVSGISYAGVTGLGIECLPAPALLAPADAATDQPPAPLLEYSSVEAADDYEVEVASDVDFANLVQDGIAVAASLRVSPPLLPGALRWWRARARGLGGVSNWSNTRHFTVASDPIAVPSGYVSDHVARAKGHVLHQFQENYG